ncbi:MAG: electron transport complex subunit RsxA [Clostridia bacterium]
MFTQLFALAITAIFIENFVLVKFLGICPFLGVSKKLSTALGMGMAVTFVMTIASIFTWCFNQFILVPLKIEYLRTIMFILTIATLVQLIEMFLRKVIPTLYNALGIYLPLITTNCAVLGVAILNVDKGYNFMEAVTFGFSAGVGFLLAIVIFSGVRERLEFADCPKCFKGIPLALISAALISISFMGFNGFKLPF